ncbi:MAG: putative DNA binding domain-containing protein [Pseudomonadota bacterium]
MKTNIDAGFLKRSIYAPMRRKLFRDLFVVIFTTFLLLVLFGYFFSLQMKKELAISLLESTTEQVKLNFLRSFDPVLNSLDLNKQWLEKNSIKPADIEKLNQQFIPLLENIRHISSVIIASSTGEQYFLLRAENQWLVRTFQNKQKNQQTVKWSRLDNNGQQIKSWQETINYDMKSRPWYQGAIDMAGKREFFISKPYLFFTQNIPGITFAGVYQPQKNNDQLATENAENKRYIFAIDITLENISQTLSELKIGENGKAFLLTREGALLLPGKSRDVYQGSQDSGGFINLSKKKHQNIMIDAITNWKNNQQTGQPIVFSINGQRWWSQFFSFNSRQNSLQAAIIVPEREFVHVLQRKSVIFFPAVVLITLFAILAAWFIVKSNTKRQKEMPKIEFISNDFKSELYDLLRRGESETLELKSTMRKNLRSGKHGKEIELAWLKGVVGFLNTTGGILLIGVDDDGVLLGLEADEFENEDKIQLHFKNLINQHIGLEFSKYINFFLEQVAEQEKHKKIIVIECKKSHQPAFLYNKNDETFYIRSGPASVSLSISKALQYIQGHKF